MSENTSTLKNISNIPKNIKVAFITADFNSEYTDALENVTSKVLETSHFRNITKYRVPGALEIPAMLKKVLEKGSFDLIYCFGVVIRGETSHYDIVCNESARGIMDMTLTYDTPIIFGLLTCEDTTQVKARINEHLGIAGLNLLSTHLDV